MVRWRLGFSDRSSWRNARPPSNSKHSTARWGFFARGGLGVPPPPGGVGVILGSRRIQNPTPSLSPHLPLGLFCFIHCTSSSSRLRLPKSHCFGQSFLVQGCRWLLTILRSIVLQVVNEINRWTRMKDLMVPVSCLSISFRHFSTVAWGCCFVKRNYIKKKCKYVKM